jgi:hypothetical protein
LLELIKAIQDIQDRKHPPLYIDNDEDDVKDDDEYVPWNSNSNFNKVTDELDQLESYKRNRYCPKQWKMSSSTVLSHVDVASGKTEEVIVGPVKENGKDLPSGKNLGNYVDTKGRMDVLQFYKDHKKDLPNLWVIVQQEAARRVDEVGCEQFFCLSGMFLDLGGPNFV